MRVFLIAKMELRVIISNFFIIACNTDKSIKKKKYFYRLTRDDESLYKLFKEFVSECSNTLLCIMHKMGCCAGDMRLENIISCQIDSRRSVRGFFENDAGRFIADFLRRNEPREERSK